MDHKISLQESASNKWSSPTFAKTTDNPPYGGYPSVNSNLNRTTLILTSSYMSSNAPIANNNKYLHKKCYYGDTLEGMPWARTNIDLSFPEIKNSVDLDQK